MFEGVFQKRVPACGMALAVLLALLACPAVPAWGGEDADLYSQLLRRNEMVNYELEYALQAIDRPPSLPDYPERMLSIRGNASVTVGGELRLDYIGSRSSAVDPFFSPDPDSVGMPGKGRIGSFHTTAARMTLDARAGDRWRAFFDLNLTGYNGCRRVARLRNPNSPGGGPPTAVYDREEDDELIREAYIELLKAGHTGFGFRAGIMEIPFGLAATGPKLIGRSFLDAPNLDGSFLLEPLARDNGLLLPHASRLYDPAVAVMVNYEMRDIIRFEAGVFQEREGGRTVQYGGDVRKYRTDSTPPLSWQAGFSILPLEDWELSATFRNRHSRSRGVHFWADSPFRWDFRHNLAGGGASPSWDPGLGQWSDGGAGEGFGARSNEQAFTVGLAVEIPDTRLKVQAEYAHGWNQGFNSYINSDNVNVGLSWRLTPFLTLHGQAEWLIVRDKSWMAGTAMTGWFRDNRVNRLYRFLLGAEYELMRNLALEGGWQYEYWKATSALGGDGSGREHRVNSANMFYVGTRFVF